jgi:hypothetical protein
MAAAVILFVLGIGLTAWPSGQVGIALVGLALLWSGGIVAARRLGPMVRFGGSFFLASAIWAVLGFGVPGSFSRWPKDDAAEAATGALPPTTPAGDRYKGLVALNASVRSTGAQLVVTNDSTQPWADVKLTIVGSGSEEYDVELEGIGAGQSVNVPVNRFATPKGTRFNPQRGAPGRTLIVTAEIGAGGPTGVYAARL